MSSVRSRQMSGSSVSSLINPVNGYRDTLRRKGVEPRNHAKENIANMRRKQAVNREAKESEERRGEQKFVMKRFRNVESRVEVRRRGVYAGGGCGAVCGGKPQLCVFVSAGCGVRLVESAVSGCLYEEV
jgi:hypothetical protein